MPFLTQAVDAADPASKWFLTTASKKSRSFGGLATHLGSICHWSRIILDQPSFDLTGPPPQLEEKASRAEILAAFNESATRTRAALDKSDAEYLGMWSLKRGGQEIFSMPRVAAFRPSRRGRAGPL